MFVCRNSTQVIDVIHDGGAALASAGHPVVRRGDLTVDRARHRASRGDRPLSFEHVWDANADPFSDIVFVTLTRLCRKLGQPSLIETVVGQGTGCDRAALWVACREATFGAALINDTDRRTRVESKSHVRRSGGGRGGFR